MLFAEESCVWVEEGVGNVAGAHRIKGNVVEIFTQIFVVTDYVVEKSGLPQMLGKEECRLRRWPVLRHMISGRIVACQSAKARTTGFVSLMSDL